MPDRDGGVGQHVDVLQRIAGETAITSASFPTPTLPESLSAPTRVAASERRSPNGSHRIESEIAYPRLHLPRRCLGGRRAGGAFVAAKYERHTQFAKLRDLSLDDLLRIRSGRGRGERGDRLPHVGRNHRRYHQNLPGPPLGP